MIPLASPRWSQVPQRWPLQIAVLLLLAVFVFPPVQASNKHHFLRRPGLELFNSENSSAKFTRPIFVKDEGNLVAIQGGKPVRGDLYFLHVTEPNAGVISISLKTMPGTGSQSHRLDNVVPTIRLLPDGGHELESHWYLKKSADRNDGMVLQSSYPSRHTQTTRATSISRSTAVPDKHTVGTVNVEETQTSKTKTTSSTNETGVTKGAPFGKHMEKSNSPCKRNAMRAQHASHQKADFADVPADSTPAKGTTRDKPVPMSVETVSKVRLLDTVAIFDMLNRYRKQLQQSAQLQDIPKDPSFNIGLTSKDITELIPLASKYKTYTNEDIFLDDGLQHTTQVSIGFSGLVGQNNITTSMLTYPQNPAKGMVIGPIQIQHRDGTKSFYAFRFRAMSADGYTVGAYQLPDKKLEEEQNPSVPIMKGSDNHYLANIQVHWEDGVLSAEVTDISGGVLESSSVDTAHIRKPTKNRFSLTPLPDSSDNIQTYVPGIGACINILSKVLAGRVDNILNLMDDQHLQALITPQTPNKYQNGLIHSGVYHSDVSINDQTLGSYRSNALVGVATWTAKQFFRFPSYAWKLVIGTKE